VARRGGAPGTTIGMDSIKQRRLTKSLNSHPDLRVGDCVPFYFCPRSVMLYNIYKSISRTVPGWNIAEAKTPSSTWRRTCIRQLPGPVTTSVVGPSQLQTQAPVTLMTTRT
jgi:hypothetical protein